MQAAVARHGNPAQIPSGLTLILRPAIADARRSDLGLDCQLLPKSSRCNCNQFTFVGFQKQKACAVNLIGNYLKRILTLVVALVDAQFGAPAGADTIWFDEAPFATSSVAALNSTSSLRRFADEVVARKSDHEIAKRLAPLVANDLKWIIGKTGWANSQAPPIQSVLVSQLRNMYFESAQLIKGVHPLALYSRTRHVIYLTDTWNSEQLFDRSILLHELVHHLQITNGVKLACLSEYEAQAYRLQIDWLRDQGVQDPYKFLNIEKAAISALSECP